MRRKITLHKLEGILASSIPLLESIFFKNNALNNNNRIRGAGEPLINNPHITPYLGNFPESFAVPAISGFIGDYIQHKGEKRDSKILKKVGAYFPEISTALVSIYFTLGESLLPQILPGREDVRDIPAVFISVLAGYTLAKIGRKSGFNNKIYSIFNKDLDNQIASNH